MGAHLCYAYSWWKLSPCAWRCWEDGSECRALCMPVELAKISDKYGTVEKTEVQQV